MTTRRPSRAAPASIARSAAQRVLTDLRIRKPREIDVELIAAHHGIQVRHRLLHHEEGHLVRAGKRAIIVVDSRHKGSEKERFTIAHELGHFFRHANVDQVDLSLCTSKDLNDWYSTSGFEPEANVFAAELLMPEFLFARRCDRNKPCLNDVRELADEFRTSLTATAIRFVEHSHEPCAVVHSTKGVIDWARRTRDFAFLPARGERLTTSTYAGDLFAGKPVDDRPQLVDGSAWPGGVDIDLQEHSMRLGSYPSVLTMLWHRYRG